MKKIVNMSLHRSATQSFHDFCIKKGLRAQHWPGFDFDRLCENSLETMDTAKVWSMYKGVVDVNDSFCDIPQPFLYEFFMQDFPESEFILILRPVQDWVNSIRRHTSGRDLDVMEKLQYWSICEVKRDHISDYSDLELEEAYRRHNTNILNSAIINGVGLSVLHLNDKSFSDKLNRIIPSGEYTDFNNVDVNRKFY